MWDQLVLNPILRETSDTFNNEYRSYLWLIREGLFDGAIIHADQRVKHVITNTGVCERIEFVKAYGYGVSHAFYD